MSFAGHHYYVFGEDFSRILLGCEILDCEGYRRIDTLEFTDAQLRRVLNSKPEHTISIALRTYYVIRSCPVFNLDFVLLLLSCIFHPKPPPSNIYGSTSI